MVIYFPFSNYKIDDRELENQLEHCKAELKKPAHYIPLKSEVFILEDRIKELEFEISRRQMGE